MLASSSYPVEQNLERVCITVKVFFVVEKRPDPTRGTPHPGWTAHPLINVCIDRRWWTIYRPKHIITDKGSAFTSQVITELMDQAVIKVSHATIKHAQTIGMIERSHQRLKQILKKKRLRRPPTVGSIRQPRCDGTQHDLPPNSEVFTD